MNSAAGALVSPHALHYPTLSSTWQNLNLTHGWEMYHGVEGSGLDRDLALPPEGAGRKSKDQVREDGFGKGV